MRLNRRQTQSYTQRSKVRGELLALLLFLSLAPCSLKADTWHSPPIERSTVAVDGVTLAVDYAKSDMDGRGIKVSRLEADGTTNVVWSAELRNTPMKVIVASGGSTVVTMDRWGAVGTDPLIFYRDGGAVLAHYRDAMKDILLTNEVPVGRMNLM